MNELKRLRNGRDQHQPSSEKFKTPAVNSVKTGSKRKLSSVFPAPGVAQRLHMRYKAKHTARHRHSLAKVKPKAGKA